MRHPGKYTFSKNPCPFRSLWASAAVICASTEFMSGVRWELMDIDLQSSKSPFPDRCCQASNMTWLSGLLPTSGYSVHLSSQTASPPVIWFSPPVSPSPIFSQSIQTNSFNLCIRLTWNRCISYSKCTLYGISWPCWKCNLSGVQIHGSFFTSTHLWDCNRLRAWMLNSWFWQNTEIVKMWGILKLPNHLTSCSDLGSLNVPECGAGAASKVWSVSLCLLARRVQISN